MDLLDPLGSSLSLPSLSSYGPSLPSLPKRKLLSRSPDHDDDYILELDYSHGLGTFAVCQRQWENKNVHSREANRPTIAKDWGTLFHTCEELRLRLGMSPALVSRQREIVSEFFQTHPVPPDEYRHADRMYSLLDLYNKEYANDHWPDSVLVHNDHKTIEVPFKLELCTIPVDDVLPFHPNVLLDLGVLQDPTDQRKALPVRDLHVFFTGKIDVVLNAFNFLWVVDHKTTSRGGKEFEEYFNLSLQTRGYGWATQKILGLPVQGLILNGVVCRPITKTGKHTEFVRRNYAYPDWSLNEWHDDAIAHVENMVTALSNGFFPQTALSFKSPCCGCDFHENCTLPPHQRAADLASALYRDVTWSPTNAPE